MRPGIERSGSGAFPVTVTSEMRSRGPSTTSTTSVSLSSPVSAGRGTRAAFR